MAQKQRQWAQGDVLITLYGGTKENIPQPKKGQMVLEGEATGHNHLLYGRALMFRDDAMASNAAGLYITSAKIGPGGAELRHEKKGKLTGDHDTIKLPANSIVEFRRQRQDNQGEADYVTD